MKKNVWLVCSLLLCLALLLAGCGQETPKAEPDLTCAQWADKIQAATGFAELTDVNEKYLEKALVIEAATLSDWAFRRDGGGTTPEMILVLRVRQGEDKTEVIQAVRDYLEEQTLMYRDYQPDQAFKLENARIMEKDGLIALAVSPDAEKVASALGGGWNKAQ